MILFQAPGEISIFWYGGNFDHPSSYFVARVLLRWGRGLLAAEIASR
jgi:hypothetical protein